MDQFKAFISEKDELIGSLQKLRAIVAKLDSLGLDAKDELEKLDKNIDSLGKDLLRIAAIGAYSDGKTTIIAGWLGKLLPDMKIGTDETTDEIKVYRPQNLPEKCEIVDTPGLFGTKRTNTDVLYSDITKKYVSEANLVFYVVDATNPLKDSHKEVAHWLFRDLQKLPNTVFVINKMDEVADLTDNESFDAEAKIKRDALVAKLSRYIELSDQEIAKLNIVCVSADPGGKGLNHWLVKPDGYQARSRIQMLKDVTTEILTTTTKDDLLRKTSLSVTVDVLTRKMREAQQQLDRLSLLFENKQQDIPKIEEDIAELRKEVFSAKKGMADQLHDLENGLLNQIHALSLGNLQLFIETDLGVSGDQVGHKLLLRISNIIEQYTNRTNTIDAGISISISSQIEATNSFLDSVVDLALNGVQSQINTLSSTPVGDIKNKAVNVRNMLTKLTGKKYKFRPHGFNNLAKDISSYAGHAQTAFEVGRTIWNSYKTYADEKKLAEIKQELSSVIRGVFSVYYSFLNDDSKLVATIAPNISNYEIALADLKQEVNEIKAKKDRFLELQNEMKVISTQARFISMDGK